MVVFTCNHCGESVHKPAIEKHYNFACRKYKDLTCVDCLKDFRGDEYSVHTKCLTEDERYSAKGSMAIGVQKKGEAKQEAWVDMIRKIIQDDINIKHQNKSLLLTISKHNNVPRKKQKFINYIKSVTGGKALENTILEVWDTIENYKDKHAKVNKANNENSKKGDKNSNSETTEMNVEEAPKKTKQKDADDSNEASKKSKKEKSKAKETETAEAAISTPSKKRKQNDIDNDGNNTKQKKNGVLETNDILEENSTPKKKKQKVRDNKETSLEENKNGQKGSLKADKKKKKKKSTSEETNGNGEILETDKSITELNEQNVSTQLDESSVIENSQENGKSFVIEDVILNILNKKNEISIEKLEKKVTTKYLKHTQETEVSQKLVKKFHKKLKKCKNIEVIDNIVKLKIVLLKEQNK